MSAESREIMTRLSRAKAYAAKLEALRTLEAAVSGLSLWAAKPLVGPERQQAESLMTTVVQGLNGMQEFKRLFPKGVPYQKGQEKTLGALLTKVRNVMTTAIAKAETERQRSRFQALDKQMLEGQRMLDDNQQLEARKHFHRVQEEFADVPGVNQDIGTRLFKCGLAAEAIEYFQAAMRQDPRDSRPCASLVWAFEQLGDLEAAYNMVKDMLKTFGGNERVFLRQATLAAKLRRLPESLDAVNRALECNPHSREGKSLLAKLEKVA